MWPLIKNLVQLNVASIIDWILFNSHSGQLFSAYDTARGKFKCLWEGEM